MNASCSLLVLVVAEDPERGTMTGESWLLIAIRFCIAIDFVLDDWPVGEAVAPLADLFEVEGHLVKHWVGVSPLRNSVGMRTPPGPGPKAGRLGEEAAKATRCVSLQE
jgi:hypothetical protein